MIRFLLYWWMTLFLLFCSCTSKTVDKTTAATNDSITKYLHLAGNESLDFEKRKGYNDKAYSYLDLSKNDTLARYYLSSLSYNYMRIKNLEKYKKTSEIHLKKSVIADDTLNMARYYRYKAAYFKNFNIYDSAFYYYLKAEKFYKETNDGFGLAVVNNKKSEVQFDINEYLGAEMSALKSYDYFRKHNNYVRVCSILIQLGLIYIELSEFDKAEENFNKVLNISSKENLPNKDRLRVLCLSNIGLVYQEQGKYDKAIKQYNLTLQKVKDIKNIEELYSNTLDNLATCKIIVKDFKNLRELIFEALKIRKKLNNRSAIILSLIHVSDYYHILGKDYLAEKYANEAIKKAKQSKNQYDYLIALEQLTNVNKKYISEYYKEYVTVNENFQVSERKARNSFARIQLETDEITKEKETAIKQKWIIVSISGVVILIIALLLIITRQRSKQKELKFIQSQQKSNEEIYDLMLDQKNKEELGKQSEKKRIALELHDGVMNKLASTRLNLNILSHKKDEQTIEKCLTYIEGIYQIEQEIRSIAHNLNQEVFNGNNSFISLLNDFIFTQNSITNTHYQIEIEKAINWGIISTSIKINLYRIIQEASHNINKFAQAKNAMISLLYDENNLCLSITDNGKGFDTEKQAEGIGLKNIKQRVETLNGKIVIQSINNKSTSLNIAIPLKF